MNLIRFCSKHLFPPSPMPFQRRTEKVLPSSDIPVTSDSSSDQLSHWEQFILSFDMQNDQNHSSNSRSPGPPEAQRAAVEIQTAVLLAHLSSGVFPSAGMMNPPHSSTSEAPQFEPTSPSPEFNRGPEDARRQFISPATLSSSSYDPRYPETLSFRGGTLPPFPFSQSFNPGPSPMSAARSRAPQAQDGPSTSTASVEAEAEGSEEYEDKRRRNTAASARFRNKKKQRTLDLEKSVSDLTGRTEELEREASELRRENGWLKEIVMLKGGRLAGVDFMNVGYPEPSGRNSAQRAKKRRDSVEDSSQANETTSEESEEDNTRLGGSGRRRKGKGKAKNKKK
ncbi:hypothetical protein B0H10DRAFT_1992958 [Mycena sp. CBHHK59/15]|nr:hypothetical protein B0H10DRAFT_1992958 [Mycena sp. CBHHK59/15]